jgi:hypothetical protein
MDNDTQNNNTQSEILQTMVQHLSAIIKDLLRFSESGQQVKESPPQLTSDNSISKESRRDSMYVLASLMRYGRLYMTKSEESKES